MLLGMSCVNKACMGVMIDFRVVQIHILHAFIKLMPTDLDTCDKSLRLNNQFLFGKCHLPLGVMSLAGYFLYWLLTIDMKTNSCCQKTKS